MAYALERSGERKRVPGNERFCSSSSRGSFGGKKTAILTRGKKYSVPLVSDPGKPDRGGGKKS